MSTIGRNDPCPSGAGVKFKKCLLRHPALNSDATAADLWWVCDRWVAPAPASPDLLVALADTQSAPLDKLDDFLNRALEAPPEAIELNWGNVFAIFARRGYPDLPRLYQRITGNLPDAPASFYGTVAKCAADRAGSLLPEIVKDFLKLGDTAVDQDAFDSVHQSAQRADRPEQIAQLEERFPHLVAPKEELESSRADEDETSQADDAKGEAADAEDENSETDNSADEVPLAPAVQARVDEVWDHFNAIKQPSRGQMDEHLANVLALPPEATDWCDLMHAFARFQHSDLATVFRRITATVPHVKASRLAWMYWAAAEEFVRLGLIELLPEVAAGFQKLDLNSYCSEALTHIQEYLLGYGLETEALALAEHFLPIQREEPNLLGWVVPDHCVSIFELRLGRRLHTPPTGMSVDAVAEQLRQGIEEDMAEEVIRLGAEIACQQAPEPAWSRGSFDCVIGNVGGSERARKEQLRLLTSVFWVAKEAWIIEHAPPGATIHGVHMIQSAAYAERTPKKKNTSKNLLDLLNPNGLDELVAEQCRDFIGVNFPKARLMLAATGLLARFALRHSLMRADEAAATEKELARLASTLGSASPAPRQT